MDSNKRFLSRNRRTKSPNLRAKKTAKKNKASVVSIMGRITNLCRLYKIRKLIGFNRLGCILTLPILLAIIIIINNNSMESRGLYIFLLIAFFWILELLPLTVTAFSPVVLFPLFGISEVGKLCRKFVTSTIMMIIGGLLFAIGIEHCNIHKRIALKVLTVMSKGIHWLMLGVMLTTMFLSMWISNTATTAMMVPIIEATIKELFLAKKISEERKFNPEDIEAIEKNNQEGIKQNRDEIEAGVKIEENIENVDISEIKIEENTEKLDSPEEKANNSVHLKIEKSKDEDFQNKPIETSITEEEKKELDERFLRMRLALLLSICFSSNCGGIGTIIGTGTNVVLIQKLEDDFPDSNVTFALWMLFNIPPMLLCIISIWFYLLFMVMKYKKGSEEEENIIKNSILKKYKELGKMMFHEYAVISLFICIIILWILKDPKFISGWADLIIKPKEKFKIGDASPALLVAFFLFLIPANPKQFKNSSPLLTWNVVHNKMPWGIIFLLGGAFAMAQGFKDAGLSTAMKSKLENLSNVPAVWIMMIISFLATLMTQAISNVATITMFLPVAKELALSLRVNPLLFMLPITICCSFAFSLPVGTPPNAIVYQASGMKVFEMMKPGFPIAMICLIIEYIAILTWGKLFFNFTEFPNWASNSTNT